MDWQIDNLKSIISLIIFFITSAISIKSWVVRPIEKLREEVKAVKYQVEDIDEKVSILTEDTAELLCSDLCTTHEAYVSKDYCPESEKFRWVERYDRYKALGRNHIMDVYKEEILSMSTSPPETCVECGQNGHSSHRG